MPQGSNLDKSEIGSTRNPERSSHKIHMYFLKNVKSPFLESEFNTYSVAKVQLKTHQFYLIKITKKIEKYLTWAFSNNQDSW